MEEGWNIPAEVLNSQTSPAGSFPCLPPPSPYLAPRCRPQTRPWVPPLGAGARLHPPGLCVSSTSLPGLGLWGALSPPPASPPTSERRVKVGLAGGEGVGERAGGDGCWRREGTSEEQEGSQRQGPSRRAGTEILRPVPADLRLGGCVLSLSVSLSLPLSLPLSLSPSSLSFPWKGKPRGKRDPKKSGREGSWPLSRFLSAVGGGRWVGALYPDSWPCLGRTGVLGRGGGVGVSVALGRKYLQRTARRTGWNEGRKRLQDAKKVMPSGARGADPLLGCDIIWAFAKGAGGSGEVAGGPGRAAAEPRGRGGGGLVPLQNPGARRAGADSEALWGSGSQRARPFAAGGQPSPGLGAGSASQLRLEALELTAESLTSCATPPGFWFYPLGSLSFFFF